MPTFNHSLKWPRLTVFLFLFSLIITACGGGGGGGGGGTSPPANTNASGASNASVTTFWTFDTLQGVNSPAIDAPGLGATLYSAAITPGKFGNAISFDASLPTSYASIQVILNRADASQYLYFSDNQISISLWVNPTSSVATGNYFLFGGGHYGVQSFHVYLADGKVVFDLYNPSNGMNDVIVTSQTSVQDGVWTHLAVTYDGNDAKVYLDGQLDATHHISHPIAEVYNNLFIGGIGDGSSAMTFPGAIDELYLAGGVFSLNRIAQLMNGYRP